MPICQKCAKEFKTKVVVDGKQRNLQRRKFCLDCSPFGFHNTSKSDPSKDESERREKRKNNVVRYVSEYRRRTKQKLLAYKGGKCMVCGYDKDVPDAYAFHHRDPNEKDFTLSKHYGKSLKTLKKEADKCDLLCVRCHAEEHDRLRN